MCKYLEVLKIDDKDIKKSKGWIHFNIFPQPAVLCKDFYLYCAYTVRPHYQTFPCMVKEEKMTPS